MFEDSLFASGVSVEAKRSARRRRWFALASVGLQGLILGAFLVVPLIWPETLPLVAVAPKVTSLFMRKPEVKVEPKPVHVVTTNDLMRVPSQAQPMVERTGVGVISRGPAIADAAEGVSLYTGGGMGGPAFAGGSHAGSRRGKGAYRRCRQRGKKTDLLHVSTGVMAGRLLMPIVPVYPRIAIAARVEGTVVVTATIDKHGRIVGLQVLSGPMMLQAAAADAVREARYRPYLLNGEPTDVTTTISVNFKIGG